MAVASASSSSLRSLRVLARPSITTSAGYASIAPYSPPGSDQIPYSNRRPSRPSSPQFFTGRPTFHESLSALRSTIESTKSSLRTVHVYPLPSHLPHLTPPTASWVSSEDLSSLFNVKLRTNTLRQVMDLLSELHHLRHISDMAGYPDLAQKIDQALEGYERLDENAHRTEDGESDSKNDTQIKSRGEVDEFGRAYASGRKKTSSARVWMIPTPSPVIESSTPTPISTATVVPTSEVLINQIPLSNYFPRPSDRETVLRPLRISGVLGAFNIFAYARGGGIAGQAGAVALGVARALSILREESKDVLQADGALMRDTRMTERKKTGRAKARKAYTWVKR